MLEHEQRIVTLEETLYFQEKLLKDLNETLQEQQKQINLLEKKLIYTEEKLMNIFAKNEQNKFVHAKPPHSVTW